MAAYAVLAYGRFLNDRPEVFPVSAWGMFAVQKRWVRELEVRRLPPAQCDHDHSGEPAAPSARAAGEVVALGGRERVLAATAWRLEQSGDRDAAAAGADLERRLFPAETCYAIVALRLDSWSRPPGQPRVVAQTGPRWSHQDTVALAESAASEQRRGRRERRVKVRKRP